MPLYYRCSSLLPALSKIYKGLLNLHLDSYLKSERILLDEQNGFRMDRSCADHIYIRLLVLSENKTDNLSTFATFIDMKKVLDYVNRQLLM